MSGDKHTPGPWTVDDSNVRGPSGVNVAVVFDPSDHAHLTPVSHANAVLISKAPLLPEMAEALRYTLEVTERHFAEAFKTAPNDFVVAGARARIESARTLLARYEPKERP